MRLVGLGLLPGQVWVDIDRVSRTGTQTATCIARCLQAKGVCKGGYEFLREYRDAGTASSELATGKDRRHDMGAYLASRRQMRCKQNPGEAGVSCGCDRETKAGAPAELQRDALAEVPLLLTLPQLLRS